MHAHRTATLAFALLALAALAAAPGAAAKKSVATSSETAPLASSGVQAGSPRCPGSLHATGGGFAVSPPYNPAGSAGTKTLAQISRPDGKKSWSVAAGAFQVPLSAGSLTSYVRCEKGSLGKTVEATNGVALVPPKSGQTMNFNCGAGTHAISGGFATDRPFAAADLSSSQLVPVQSQRVSTQTWVVSAFNSSATLPTNMIGYAVCEKNKGAGKISARTATAPLSDDARTSLQPSCPKRQHVVSGGFVVAPLPVAGGTVPSAGIDENMPVGKRSWKIGAYENPGFVNPPGSSLTAQALCKRD